MLTESFHGSPSAQRDLSVAVGTRGPYSRDLWSTYMIPFCRKEMCALLRNKVITFILRLCHFPIRDVRAQTYLPPSCRLSPAHSLSLFTIVGAIPRGRWKEPFLLLDCWQCNHRSQCLAGRRHLQSQPGLVHCWWVAVFWSPCLGSCIALLSWG